MNETNYTPPVSIFAKILAKENIHVTINSYNKTASFDTLTRTLTLPNWQGFESHSWYLLVAHEVGHALFTPVNIWASSRVRLENIERKYKVNKNQIMTVLNVVEDIRIERKIRDKYMGLTGFFYRGYKALLEKDFFGFGSEENLKSKKWAKYKTLDRLNIYAKVGGLLDLKLQDPNHIRWYKAAIEAETFDHVIDIAEDIIKTIKENIEKEQDPHKEENKPNSESKSKNKPKKSSNSKDSKEKSTDSGREDIEKSKEDEEVEEQEEQEEEKESGSTKEDQDSEEEQEDDYSVEPSDEELPEAEPEYSYDYSEQDFDTDTKSFSDKLLEKNTSGTEKRLVIENDLDFLNSGNINLETLLSNWGATPEGRQNFIQITNHYYNKSKIALTSMVSRFRVLQSAITSRKIKTSKTGTLDPNKIHSYKTIEDIFLRRTTIEKGQNHGIVINIDWSSSMEHQVSGVLWQTLNLIWFAEQLQIPVEVYAFSNNNNHTSYPGYQIKLYASDFRKKKEAQAHIMALIYEGADVVNYMTYKQNDSIEFSGTGIPNIPHLPFILKKDIREVLKNYSKEQITMAMRQPYAKLYYTPMYNALFASVSIIKKFRLKHRIEKCISIWLTDGQSDGGIKINKLENHTYNDKTILYSPTTNKEYNLPNQTVTVNGPIKYHRDATGATVIFLHLGNGIPTFYFSESFTRKAEFDRDGVILFDQKTNPSLGPDALIISHMDYWNNDDKFNAKKIDENTSLELQELYKTNMRDNSMKKFSELITPFLAQGRKD